MRPPRFLRPAHSPVAVVHAMSRVIEGRVMFDDRAKEEFRKFLAKQCVSWTPRLDTPPGFLEWLAPRKNRTRTT